MSAAPMPQWSQSMPAAPMQQWSQPMPAAPVPQWSQPMSAAPMSQWSQPMSAAPMSQRTNRACPQTAASHLEQNYPLAMAYVPWQQWQQTYAPERGLAQGTIFPDLDLQFDYGRCTR